MEAALDDGPETSGAKGAVPFAALQEASEEASAEASEEVSARYALWTPGAEANPLHLRRRKHSAMHYRGPR